MSTRALYSFIGETAADSWNVYKHSDGYPTGAAETLQNAVKYFAWQLPRYEPDEFAAAFIAAGKASYFLRAALAKTAKEKADALMFTAVGEYKSQGGNLRMMPQGAPLKVAGTNCGDIEYRYEIYQGNDGGLRVKAYGVNAWGDKPKQTLLLDCPIAEFTPDNADVKELES